jgi:TetR/AcrR family transcriptional regulator, regulator of mycofactocin system
MALTEPALPVDSDLSPHELSPRERRMAKTRRAIIDAARELFDEQGYNETTIDQIADRADIAPRTFFRYFPAKEALAFAEFEDLRSELWLRLEARPAKEPPMRSVVNAFADFAATVEANHGRLEWGFRIAAEHPHVHDLGMSNAKTEAARRLTAFVAERLGVDPDVDPRPSVWTQCVMAVFAAAVRSTMGADEHPDGSARERFLELYAETATTLKGAVPR